MKANKLVLLRLWENAIFPASLQLKHADSFPGPACYMEFTHLKILKNTFKGSLRNKIIARALTTTIIIVAFGSAAVYPPPPAPFVGGNLISQAQMEESLSIQLLKSNILPKEEPLLLFLWRVPLSCSKQLCWYLDTGYQLSLYFQHNLYSYPAGFVSPQMVHNACAVVSQPNSACCLSGV